MANGFISRSFTGTRRQANVAGRFLPGPYVTPGFPVLSLLQTWRSIRRRSNE